jgi:transcriptional regulator with XRE-family HTH domain
MMSHMSTKLSSWLNDQTKSHGWSFRYVSRRAGVSHSTIARLANAEVKPTPESCQALARAFDVPVEEIMSMAGLLALPNMPSGVRPLRERVRVVYEVNGDDLVLQLWRALSPEDQRIVRDLMERLAPSNQTRIVGDEGE